MLYILVIGPIPIVHTNVQENPLTTFGFTDILKLFNEFELDQWVTNNIFSVYLITVSVSYEEQKFKKI